MWKSRNTTQRGDEQTLPDRNESISITGTHFVNGALNRDYSLILGVVLLYSALLVFLNLVSDVLLTLVDPRIRREA